MPEELQDKIEENAQAPRRAVVDGVEAEQHSLPDQIAADRYLAAKEAAKKPHRGLRFTQLRHSGAD